MAVKTPLAFLFVLLLAISTTAAGQVPAAVVVGVSAARFESGTVIRLPEKAICTGIEVSIPQASPVSDRVDLHVDEARLATQNFSQSGNLVLEYKTPEPLGLLRKNEQVLQALRIARVTEKLGEWTIVRWPRSHIEAVKSVPGGRAPDVRILQPPGEAFLVRSRPERVAVKGSVVSRTDIVVRVAGMEIKAERDGDSWTFSADVPLPGDSNEVEVYVRDLSSGAARWMILPVQLTSR